MPDAVAWWDEDKVDDVGEAHEMFLADGGLIIARQASPPADHFCQVFDMTELATSEPAWTSLADAKRDYLRWYGNDPHFIDVSAVYVDVPAGRTLAIDCLDQDGCDGRDYIYTASGTWFTLVCYASPPPDDRWLSIAETFEFLPEAA